MTLTLEHTPDVEACLNAEAEQRGVLPESVAAELLGERAALATQTNAAIRTPDPKNAAAIAYFEQRIRDEATDDPEEIRKTEEELEELKRNMNANRAAAGDRRTFL